MAGSCFRLESALGRGVPPKRQWITGSGVLPRTAACGKTLRELGKYKGEVEYPAVSVAIARFQNRLKTERSLQTQSNTDREIVES